MIGNVDKRCIELGEYIVNTNATVRQAAHVFGISKSTVHIDVTKRLAAISPALAEEVNKILQENKAQAFASQCWKTSDGYAGKLFIDFSVCKELKQIAEEGGIASFSFVFADMETGDDRLQVSNTAHNVETKKGIPVQMGKIKFVKGEESNENDA